MEKCVSGFGLTPNPNVAPQGKKDRAAVRAARVIKTIWPWWKESCPKDTSKARALTNVTKLIRAGESPAHLIEAARNYLNTTWHGLEEGEQPEYVKFCGNFFGREKMYVAFMPGEFDEDLITEEV